MTVKTFISRPLLSIVISVFIVLLGVISLLSLPVERYPDIAPPAIYVWASYPGTSAETVHKSVVMSLEEAIDGLSVTLFTTTLVFMVIFIPVAFMGGTTGIFFKQFGLTMAVAVGISLINALTLSPALCTLMLKPSSVETCHGASLQKSGTSSLQSRIRTAYDITFNTLLKHYANMVSWLLGRKWLTVGSVADGSSSGRAIKAIQETAAKELPVGYSIEFGGITREESQTSGRVIFIFLICIVFAYLVMVALYESLFIPLSVMLSVPFGLAGSLLFAKLFGVENNIYMQIGMVMLVGLLSKTAILLTEYASQARRGGMSLADAALRSAKVRLRPILMTSLTMIIGMLPLMFASGLGANGSRTIGVCVVGGMLFGTLGLLLTVPVLFAVFQKIQERVRKNKSDQ